MGHLLAWKALCVFQTTSGPESRRQGPRYGAGCSGSPLSDHPRPPKQQNIIGLPLL